MLVASRYRFKISVFQQLICASNYMICELQYRPTPLPRLCQMASEQSQGCVKKIFHELALELESQILPDARRCMVAVLNRYADLPIECQQILCELGSNMGKFNLQGQVSALESAKAIATEQLEALKKNKDIRLRSYQTLGLCAGAAIAILLV